MIKGEKYMKNFAYYNSITDSIEFNDEMRTYDNITIRYENFWNTKYKPSITKVIFNPPATIVLWNDDTKTVVKTQNGEAFDPEKGLAMAISKKAFGNKGNYFEQIKKWTEPYKEEKAEFENDIINFLKELGELTLKGYKSGLTKNE